MANRTIIDLFCGAGGLSLGFANAGFRTVIALDHWRPAVETYRRNLGDDVSEADLATMPTLPEATVIAGGPPCQGFSSAGLRRHHDHRNTLVGAFANMIVERRPEAFVFENVEGFLTIGGGQFVFDLLEPLADAGYRIRLAKLNAANFGVPQHRKRVIAVGGLGWNPELPEPTHTAWGAPGSIDLGDGFPRTSSLADALAGLPKSKIVNGVPQSFGHDFTPLKGMDAERAAHLRPGQRMRDLPQELWHDSYGRRARRRVLDGTPSERRGGAPSGVRRLRLDEPSKAITGGALNEFIHPIEDRPLTVRECARLQTFPDDFVFCGSRAEQVQLIGNAVPPVFAEAIASALLRSLAERATSAARESGALLSFLPSASAGMSPALRATCEAVAKRFGVGPACMVERQMVLWDGTN